MNLFLRIFPLVTFCVSASASIITSPSAGYLIGWDGNDGVGYGGAVPANLALASAGATPIAHSQLGLELSLPYHLISNLNDGLYGNANSWIGDSTTPGPFFAGVLFAGPVAMTSIAFGRDNLTGSSSSFNDRYAGTYTIQFTMDNVSWIDIGTVTKPASVIDHVPGGGYTGYLRHEFTVSTDTLAPILATGIRFLVPGSGLATGTAIDEIEVYGVLIPEPSVGVLGAIVFILAGSVILRNRRKKSDALS